MKRVSFAGLIAAVFAIGHFPLLAQEPPDVMRQIQLVAIVTERADWGHWGVRPQVFSAWTNHSNRLIPVYVFGGNLKGYSQGNSLYRHEGKIQELYGYLPADTLNLRADYFDQTDLYRLQQDAVQAGKRNIFLLVLDGMDWQTTWAAATYRCGKVMYQSGRGTGLAFQDYSAAETDFGWMVTSALLPDAKSDKDRQTVTLEGIPLGGYSANFGGAYPWGPVPSLPYLIGQTKEPRHLVTDSASSATSMFSGIKTYNSAINVTPAGKQVVPIARDLQQKGWTVGVVTSVPISHATPAAAYANNVDRDDYQDLTRDLIGLPSIAHPVEPLAGLDVLIGAGWGERKLAGPEEVEKQGTNFVAGNRYVTDHDLEAISRRPSNSYVIAQREKGKAGSVVVAEGARRASESKQRLFGFFGGSHLPYQTADGRFNPTRGVSAVDVYSAEDLVENPTLAECTSAALTVLQSRSNTGIWMLVEAGDVDWANHNNNLDDAIGAVFSGEAAFQTIVKWVEMNSDWDESMVIVTADHGHLLNLLNPQAIAEAGSRERSTNKKD